MRFLHIVLDHEEVQQGPYRLHRNRGHALFLRLLVEVLEIVILSAAAHLSQQETLQRRIAIEDIRGFTHGVVFADIRGEVVCVGQNPALAHCADT